MHLIVYTSKIRQRARPAAQLLTEIVEVARCKNNEFGITGVLLCENGYFLQAIEGDEVRLRALFENIRQDTRHEGIVTLVDEPVSMRAFDDWSLDTFSIDCPKVFDPETIGMIGKLYNRTFEMNSKLLIEFIKKVIDEIDTFKISHEGLQSNSN